jgi:hypothetical protein
VTGLSWRGRSVRPVERTSNVRCPVSGVQASGVQASGVQVSGRTGRRSPRQCRRAVRVALDLEGLGGGRPAGRSGSRCPRCPRAGGRLPASGLTGSEGAAVDRARLPRVDRRPGPTLGRRPGCGAAWPPGRHGLVQGQVPAGWGSPGHSRCSPVPPQGVWAVAGVVPDHGPGPRGGDHAGWSLGEGWSCGVQLPRPHPVRWGAARGRSAAAVGEERRPLGADRSLTSENSGGRDRV